MSEVQLISGNTKPYLICGFSLYFRYFIVDINYMPGYERLPDFENLFINFLKIEVEKAKGGEKDVGNSNPAELSTPYPLLAKKKWGTVRAALKLLSLANPK